MIKRIKVDIISSNLIQYTINTSTLICSFYTCDKYNYFLKENSKNFNLFHIKRKKLCIN